MACRRRARASWPAASRWTTGRSCRRRGEVDERSRPGWSTTRSTTPAGPWALWADRPRGRALHHALQRTEIRAAQRPRWLANASRSGRRQASRRPRLGQAWAHVRARRRRRTARWATRFVPGFHQAGVVARGGRRPGAHTTTESWLRDGCSRTKEDARGDGSTGKTFSRGRRRGQCCAVGGAVAVARAAAALRGSPLRPRRLPARPAMGDGRGSALFGA